MVQVREAVIVDAIRTPFGKRKGSFRDTHPEVLGAAPLKALTERNGLTPDIIDDVIYGNVTPVGEQGLNIGRKVALLAGWGDRVPGFQLNRMCGSGQQAVNLGAALVASGYNDIVIAGGVEHMTRVSIGSDAGPVSEAMADQYEIVHQGESAERIADKWGFSRQQLDEFAAESQARYKRALDEGRYKSQIIPVEVEVDGERVVVSQDEHPRPGTTAEKLAGLPPAFRPDNGKVHAGNSSGIVDGAAALLVTTPDVAAEHGWTPKARIRAIDVIGTDPTIMLTGPIPATQRVLKKAGMEIGDIDLFECNEAFAPIPMAWMNDTEAPYEKVNVNGGAIAHGHPLGATGAALVTKLVHELERTGKTTGLSTMCIGFGMGIATVIERL